MLPDFEMVCHQIPTPDPITIIPVFDVHLGSRECMEKEFADFVEWVRNTPNTFVVLGGDLIDNGLKNSLTNVYRAVYSPSTQKKLMANLLSPIRDRILCCIDGNHERRSNREVDDSPCRDIMAKLDLEHLHRENMAFLKVQIGKGIESKVNSIYRPIYTFCVCHGAGGGMLPGGVINRNERTAYAIEGIDALIVGHSHKPMMSQPGRIVVDSVRNKVSVVPFKVISATSWLSYGDYAAQKMLLPTSHCLQKIILSAYKKEMVVTM